MHVSGPTLKWLSALALVSLVLGAVGCSEEPDAKAAGERADEASEGDEPDKAGPAAPEGPGPASDDDDHEGRESVEDAIGTDPTVPDGDPCQSAYSSMRATIDAMNKRTGGKTKKAAMPPKDRFLAACAELPEQMQRCMGIRYHMAHEHECKKAADEVDPALKKRVQEMMGRPPSGGGTP